VVGATSGGSKSRHPELSAVQQAYDAVMEYVKSAPIGTRLPAERELASRFGVSRTTVRSAIDRLVLSGHLSVRRGSGSVTRKPGPEHLATPFAESLAGVSSLQEVYAVRLILEPQLAAQVARRPSPAITAALSSAHEDDGHFHTLLASQSGNSVARQVISVLVALAAPDSGASEPSRSVRRTRERQHLAVVEAIAEGDADLARQAMRLHLRWEARLLTAKKST